MLLSGCQSGKLGNFFASLFGKPKPPVVADIKYVVGPGYPAGGIWYYPRESFSYDMTGIAEIIATPHQPLTTDGEIFDANAMAGAHQTLQLPVIVRVTNLSNGRQVRLRLNDRGPAMPSRILAVTRRAAELLAFDPDGTARVRVEVDPAPSQALAQQLNGAASRIDVQTAPVGSVQSASLPPPPGFRAAAPRGSTPLADPSAAGFETDEQVVPLHLPEAILQVAPMPGTLWIIAGSFGRAAYARRRAAQLADTGAVTGIVHDAGQTSYTVRIGPIDTIAAADSLMQQVIRDGVSDARVIVE